MQHRDAFSRFKTVSVAVNNKGGEFFHPTERVSDIATRCSTLPSEGKTKPILGKSVGRSLM